MSDNPEVASLTRLVLELQRQVRNLGTGNPLNRGSVLNAEGRYVPISQIAFGQVPASTPGNLVIWGSTGGPGGTAWTASDGPGAWVYVAGGQLRVDLAARINSYGNNCSMFGSWAVFGPSAAPGGALGPEVVGPDYARAVEIQYPGVGMGNVAGLSTFDFHQDLPIGWYFVSARYALSYSGNPDVAPYGEASYRRLLLTPF